MKQVLDYFPTFKAVHKLSSKILKFEKCSYSAPTMAVLCEHSLDQIHPTSYTYGHNSDISMSVDSRYLY